MYSITGRGVEGLIWRNREFRVEIDSLKPTHLLRKHVDLQTVLAADDLLEAPVEVIAGLALLRAVQRFGPLLRWNWCLKCFKVMFLNFQFCSLLVLRSSHREIQCWLKYFTQ